MKLPKGKRILMLLENAPYPSDERVRHEALALLSNGYSVTVICPREKNQAHREIINGIQVYRYSHPPSSAGLMGYLLEYGYSILAIFSLSLYVLLKDGFDAIHTAQPPDTFVFIAMFYKILGKLYILDHHDLAPELYDAHFRGKGGKIIYRTLIWLESLSFHFADHVITTNESYKQIALQRGRVEERRITIVRNGPDLEELNNPDMQLSLPKDGKVIIGYVGVTGIQDGVDHLLKALHYLTNKLNVVNTSCIVLGDGSAMPGLKSLANELGIDSYIQFTGWINRQEEVAEYLKNMDICVAPEPSDPYNSRSTAAKIMEYMAMGKAIVSSDLPEHRFTARNAAIYAVPGDVKDFAEKIAFLVAHPEQRQLMGRAGQSRILAELAWPFQAKKLLDAYKVLL